MRFSQSPRTTSRHASSPRFRRKPPRFAGGVGDEDDYPYGPGAKEGYDADVARIDIVKFAGSLLENLGHHDVHQWVEWAWTFDFTSHNGISRIFTRSDRHYLDGLRKCAETIGKVAYAHFFVTTMLHRFTTRVPTWGEEVAIPSTLREILLIMDEFSEQPILGGSWKRGH
jgi:hypothetical protein